MVFTLPEQTLNELTEKFGEKFKSLRPDEVQAMVAAAVEGEINNQRLQEMLTLHRVDITRMLRGLVRAGLLTADGVGRGTRYSLAHSAPPTSFPHKAAESDAGSDRASEKLALIASVRQGERAKPELLRRAILSLCEGRFLTIQQLAQELNREVNKLRDRNVSPLVVEGRLTLRFPKTPRHPEQSYKTSTEID